MAGRSDILVQPRSSTSVKSIVLVLGLAMAVSACTRTNPFASSNPNAASPLTPAPLSPVNESQLSPAQPTPPPPGAEPLPDPNGVGQPGTTVAEPVTQEPVKVAKVDPSVAAKPVTRQSMVGAWTVSTGGSNCQIFLALTKWSGGYRAASRGCSAQAIKDVQAWDVRGKQVVLVNSSGGTAATLFRSSTERFDGSTAGGGSISFSR